MKTNERVDTTLLQKRAVRLRQLLEDLVPVEPVAASCLSQLEGLLRAAETGELKSPVSEVPCGHYFHFDELRKYSEIEVAYSNFAFSARGVDDEELKRIMESISASGRT